MWMHFVTNQSTSISRKGLVVMPGHPGFHSLVEEARFVYKKEENNAKCIHMSTEVGATDPKCYRKSLKDGCHPLG